MTVPLYGMCTVCNEADILAECLRHAAAFHDRIYVVDCGSEDASPQLARELADELEPVEYLGAIGPHHSRQVRRHIWERFRHELPPGAWWSIVDADEFLELDPRPSLAEASLAGADHAFAIQANFYYKQTELKDWRTGRETLADRTRSITERRRWYRMHSYQIRFFQELSRLRWLEDTSFPTMLAQPASKLIAMRHYQYRDADQIALRLRTRLRWIRDADLLADSPHWDHQQVEDVCSAADDPDLLWFEPGQPLQIDPYAPRKIVGDPPWRCRLKHLVAATRYAFTPQPTPRLP